MTPAAIPETAGNNDTIAVATSAGIVAFDAGSGQQRWMRGDGVQGAEGAVPCQGALPLRLVQRLTLVGLVLGPRGRHCGGGDRGGRADQGQAQRQHSHRLVGSTHGILPL